MRINVARIFNIDGPRMHANDGRVVSNFIVQALRNRPITIYGEGTQTRSFCYVDDLIEGFVRLMDSPDDLTGPINLGNPGEFTMIELAEANPALSQRDLAKALGISLGGTNDCLRAPIDRGLIKIQDFRNSCNKRADLYPLTPQGIKARARITVRFLQRKEAEYHHPRRTPCNPHRRGTERAAE